MTRELHETSSSSAAPASSAAASASAWSNAGRRERPHRRADAPPGACPRACDRCRRSSSSRPTCTTTPQLRRAAAPAATRWSTWSPSCTAARPSFERVHVELPRAWRAACAAAGVRRVVHVSALGVGADAPSNYLRSKTAGEAVLAGARAGPDDAAAVGDLRRRRPLPQPVRAAAGRCAGACRWPARDARFQPVWVEDVAAAIVRCLDDRDDHRPDHRMRRARRVTRWRELVRLAGRWSGHERPVMRAARRRSAGCRRWLMELLPGEPLMSRDNVDSMRCPTSPAARCRGWRALGISARRAGSGGARLPGAATRAGAPGPLARARRTRPERRPRGIDARARIAAMQNRSRRRAAARR